MSLMLHRGAEEIPFAELQEAPTPQATKTHVPIAHHSLVSHVRYALGMHGHVVTEEHHGVTPAITHIRPPIHHRGFIWSPLGNSGLIYTCTN